MNPPLKYGLPTGQSTVVNGHISWTLKEPTQPAALGSTCFSECSDLSADWVNVVDHVGLQPQAVALSDTGISWASVPHCHQPGLAAGAASSQQWTVAANARLATRPLPSAASEAPMRIDDAALASSAHAVLAMMLALRMDAKLEQATLS